MKTVNRFRGRSGAPPGRPPKRIAEVLHRCFWPTCRELLTLDQIGCAPHWHALPGDVKRELLATRPPYEQIAPLGSAERQRAVKRALQFARDTIKRDAMQPDLFEEQRK